MLPNFFIFFIFPDNFIMYRFWLFNSNQSNIKLMNFNIGSFGISGLLY